MSNFTHTDLIMCISRPYYLLQHDSGSTNLLLLKKKWSFKKLKHLKCGKTKTNSASIPVIFIERAAGTIYLYFSLDIITKDYQVFSILWYEVCVFMVFLGWIVCYVEYLHRKTIIVYSGIVSKLTTVVKHLFFCELRPIF